MQEITVRNGILTVNVLTLLLSLVIIIYLSTLNGSTISLRSPLLTNIGEVIPFTTRRLSTYPATG